MLARKAKAAAVVLLLLVLLPWEETLMGEGGIMSCMAPLVMLVIEEGDDKADTVWLI